MFDENSTTQLMAIANLMNVKDSRWLQLEVCREFQRGQCSRSETECKFSHPPPHVEIQNGRVTACYDSIKGRCTRDNPKCKYLHPPQHLKDQLLINGRNNLTLKNLLMNQLTTPVTTSLGVSPLTVTNNGGLLPGVATAYNPYAAAYAINPAALYPGLVASPDVLGSMGSVLQANNVNATAAAMAFQQAQKAASVAPTVRTDRVEVCREHLRSACPRASDECKYAHPDASTVQKNGGCADGTITVCMDYVLRGSGSNGCSRDNCRYFHPPPHLALRGAGGCGAAASASAASSATTAGSSGAVSSRSSSQSRDGTSAATNAAAAAAAASFANAIACQQQQQLQQQQQQASSSPQPLSAAVAVAQALAARAAAANAAAMPNYQQFMFSALPTQQQMSVAQMAAMHVPRNVLNQCVTASTGNNVASSSNNNSNNNICTSNGHANPKKRPLEPDSYLLNQATTTNDPYLLAAAQALASSAAASNKRAALDKSGVPFYQQMTALPAGAAAGYPFNFQYPQFTAATPIPGFPAGSYFPAAAFTLAGHSAGLPRF